MATLRNVTGFEYGLGTPSTNGGGLFTTLVGAGTSVTIQATYKRTGGYALRCNPSSALCNANKTTSGSPAVMVGSLYVMWHAWPSVQLEFFTLVPSSGNGSWFYLNNTTHKISAQVYGGTAQTYNTALSLDTWYRLDFRLTVSGNPHTIDWAVDGNAQTQATYGQAGATISSWVYGNYNTSGSVDVIYDDVVLSYTTGDYPIGAHAVIGLSPNAAGTSNPTPSVTNIQDNSSTTVNDSTNPANVELDEVPFGTTTDFIKQIGGTSSIYAAVGFADTAQTSILGVMAYEAYHSASGSPANSASARVYDGTTETAIYTGDMSESSVFYKSVIMPNPSGGWTMALVNGIQGRVGFATDYAPVPYWDTLMLEVAYSTAAVAYVLQTTTGSFALSGSNAILLFKRLIKVTAGAFALTGNNAKMLKGYPLKTTVGTFALSGNNAVLLFKRLVKATVGSYALSGSEILKEGRLVKVTVGAFTLSGNNAVIAKGYPLKTTVGAFTLSGSTAYLLFKRQTRTTTGAFILSGSNAYLRRGLKILETTGAFVLSGSNADLRKTNQVRITVGAFVLSGSNASLRKTNQVRVTTGAFILSGSNGILKFTHLVKTTVGVFVWAGNDAILTYSAGAVTYHLLTVKGDFVLFGSNAYLRYYRKMFTTAGSYLLSGQNAKLLNSHKIFSATGVYSLAGSNALLTEGRKLFATKGIFTETGNNAQLLFGRKILTTTGAYAFAGRPALLLLILKLMVDAGAFSLAGQDAILLKGQLATGVFEMHLRDRAPELTLEYRDTMLSLRDRDSGLTLVGERPGLTLKDRTIELIVVEKI